jgi:nucleolar complex protein 2
MLIEFMRNTKFINAVSMEKTSFMMNCMLELFMINERKSYQIAFQAIKQMALSIRNALNDNRAENVQKVYNWQFVYQCKLWAKLICENGSDLLEKLSYPLIQVMLGSLR